MITTLRPAVVTFAAVAAAAPAAQPQEPGAVRGRVRAAHDGEPLAGVVVTVKETPLRSVTGQDGRYVLREVPPGTRVVVLRWLGYRPREDTLTVRPGSALMHDVSMTARPVLLSTIVVEGASRVPQRVVEAPAAAWVVPPSVVRDAGVTGQAPRALLDVPGVDVVQSGMHDFNVSARGFNRSLAKRVLVLQDGRDVAHGTFGFPHWPGMNTLHGGTIEVVRGPASALFGANAYLGVVNYTSSPVRDVVGTMATVSGGELHTMRADVQHAAVSTGGRIGLRVSAGLSRSRSWSRSRTAFDGGALRREYADVTDDPVPDWQDALPLLGQTADPATGTVLGDPDPVSSIRAGARLDYYLPNGSVVTVEGAEDIGSGAVGGAGRNRVQGDGSRPWARAAWSANRFAVSAWWAGDHADLRSLLSGATFEVHENVFHGEGQVNAPVLGGRGRIVAGASYRTMFIDTRRTVLGSNDDRRDELYALFGQVEYQLSPGLRLVGAFRWDDANYFRNEFSPRAAVVWSPHDRHSVRIAFNRAFLTPFHNSLFIDIPIGPPLDFAALEDGLRASSLGPALDGVPRGTLFTSSSAVPIRAFGNSALDNETVVALEVGYKGQLGDRVFVTIDAYYHRLSNFETGSLPGNPVLGPWTAPQEVPAASRSEVERAVRDQLQAAGQSTAALGLTRLPDGTTAVVLSPRNAGRAEAAGLELATGLFVLPELRVDASYSLFAHEIQSQDLPIDDFVGGNSPKHKLKLAVSYAGRSRLDARVSARFSDSYQWIGPLINGSVPSRQWVDASAGYRLNNHLRVHVIATNVFDQRRFTVYGGSVIGRRALAGLTVTW